jgi:hypothetical protein
MAPHLARTPELLAGLVVQLSTGERLRLALIRTLALHSPSCCSTNRPGHWTRPVQPSSKKCCASASWPV